MSDRLFCFLRAGVLLLAVSTIFVILIKRDPAILSAAFQGRSVQADAEILGGVWPDGHRGVFSGSGVEI